MGLELLLPVMILALIALMFFQSSKQRKAMKDLQEMQASLAVGGTAFARFLFAATGENENSEAQNQERDRA